MLKTHISYSNLNGTFINTRVRTRFFSIRAGFHRGINFTKRMASASKEGTIDRTTCAPVSLPLRSTMQATTTIPCAQHSFISGV